jgi:Xaa-Pro aminopeptidase
MVHTTSHERIEKLKSILPKWNIGYLVIDDPIDLFYLTGLWVSLGKLLVSTGAPILFVDGRYIAFAKEHAPCSVELLDTFATHLPKDAKVGFDSAFVTFDGYQTLLKNVSKEQVLPVSQPLKTLRMIKSKPEVDALRRAAKLTKEGYQHVLSLLKEGITEAELSFEFEWFCRKRGASKLSFAPIIAFGENSAYPHYRSGNVKLKKDQVVLIDVGAVVDNYAGDMTRVAFFGKPDEQLHKDYECIQRAQKKAIALVKPKERFGNLMDVVLKELGPEKAFFNHGLSHGIGIDVHEYPRLKIQGGETELALEEGMAFSVEPGIYRPGLGGVRFEDVVVVTHDGHEVL